LFDHLQYGVSHRWGHLESEGAEIEVPAEEDDLLLGCKLALLDAERPTQRLQVEGDLESGDLEIVRILMEKKNVVHVGNYPDLPVDADKRYGIR
jgi:hypothetical protein